MHGFADFANHQLPDLGLWVVAVTAASAAAHGTAEPLRWSSPGSDGTLSVRSVVMADAACPEAMADGVGLMMRPHAAAEAGFPVVV